MDKNKDFEIYLNNGGTLDIEHGPINQRKVLHSRILRNSSAKSKISYGIMGMTLSNSSSFQESVFPLKKAAIINPTYAKIHIRLAESLLKLGKIDECLDSIKKGLLFSPQVAALHRLLIETLEKNHRLEDLEPFLGEIARMIADMRALQDLFFASAETLLSCNKYAQAITSYQKAFKIDSATAIEDCYYYNYGLALYHEGEFEEAIVQFEHAWKLNPSEKMTINNIVYLHYCLGRVEKALGDFEEIFQNGLETHVTYSNYLLLLYHLDQNEDVISKYKDVLQPYIESHGQVLRDIYQEELRITETVLEKEDLDEETKEFNEKKLEGINLLLSLLY